MPFACGRDTRDYAALRDRWRREALRAGRTTAQTACMQRRGQRATARRLGLAALPTTYVAVFMLWVTPRAGANVKSWLMVALTVLAVGSACVALSRNHLSSSNAWLVTSAAATVAVLAVGLSG